MHGGGGSSVKIITPFLIYFPTILVPKFPDKLNYIFLMLRREHNKAGG